MSREMVEWAESSRDMASAILLLAEFVSRRAPGGDPVHRPLSTLLGSLKVAHQRAIDHYDECLVFAADEAQSQTQSKQGVNLADYNPAKSDPNSDEFMDLLEETRKLVGVVPDQPDSHKGFVYAPIPLPHQWDNGFPPPVDQLPYGIKELPLPEESSTVTGIVPTDDKEE